MNISVDTLRSLSGNNNIVFDAQTKSLTKAGAGHSIASFFGSKSAQAVNRQTLDEIKKAIICNDRYFGVRDKASQLLSQIDSAKSIKASTIKSIVDQLDSLSTKALQQTQLKERFSVHLAARDLPAGWGAHADKIKSYLDRNVSSMINKAGSAAKVPVSIELQKLCDALAVVSEKSGGDKRIVDFAAEMLVRRQQAVNTPEQADKLVGKLKSVLAELDALNNQNPGTRIVERGISIMTAMSTVVKPGVMTALHDAAKMIDPAMVNDLARNEGGDVSLTLHNTLKNLFDKVASIEIKYPEGGALDDSDGMLSALKFIFGDFAASLDDGSRSALLQNMTSGEGINLCSFYNNISGKTSINNFKIFDAMVKSLQESLGEKPDGVKVPEECNFSKIPVKIMGEFPAQTMYVQAQGGLDGNKFIKTRQNLMEDLAQIRGNQFVSADDVLRDHINTRCTSWGREIVMSEMKHWMEGSVNTFQKDIVRGLKATLPNGVRLPNNFEQARNEVIKYVSKNTCDNFETADVAMKKKASLLMSFLSQESEKLASLVALSLPSENKFELSVVDAFDKTATKREFTIVETQDGGWHVNVDMELSIDGIMFPPEKDPTKDTVLWLGSGSALRGHVDMKISGEEIARLSEVDAENFIEEREAPVIDVEAAVAFNMKPKVN